MKKLCGKCQTEKDVEEFYRRGKTGRQPWCKTCCATRHTAYYQADPERAYRNRTNRRKSMREWFNTIKESLTCNRCSENHPATLQFHHTDPEEKELALAEMLTNGYSKERVLKEMEKCEVLCANCHTKEHYQQEKWLFRSKK